MKKKTRSQLVKEADKWFSLYVRHRDADEHGLVPCITCPVRRPIKQMQAGHFMSRRFYATRWDEENCNGQCTGCNMFKSGEQYKYSLAVDDKYGKGTAQKLASAAQEIRKITSSELEDIIRDCKTQIEYLGGNGV